MLNGSLNRRPLTQPVRLAAVTALLGLTVAIAGVGTSAQTASATFSGFVVDATGAGVPGVTVTLAHAGQPILRPGKPLNIRFSKANVKNVLNVFGGPTGLNISYDAGVPDRPAVSSPYEYPTTAVRFLSSRSHETVPPAAMAR